MPSRLVPGPTQRGILTEVLQPGIYYLNPRLVKVTIVPIGYDAITLDAANNTAIRFYSSDGYQIEADFTVVWGRAPKDAPAIIANIGGVDQVRDNVIEPVMKAACQNEVARQPVAAETMVKTAGLQAEGAKQAAEIDAQRDLKVADVEKQIAELNAERTQILGQADAEVLRLKNDAEANGAKMLIDAFGSPQSYNLYTFARNFEPQDLKMIFAGPGTFWTDLKSFQNVGASKMVQQQAQDRK